MAEFVPINVEDTLPDPAAILAAQGVFDHLPRYDKYLALAKDAVARYADAAEPRALLMDITVEQFDKIYSGEGQNAVRTPLENIYPRSNRLFLMAATVGSKISKAITGLFDRYNFAEAANLDAAASEGAERTAMALDRHYVRQLKQNGDWTIGDALLRFSPGYCGWHITAQRKLFERLKPEKIGISLNDSCLMHPLKSISAVGIVGPVGIFDFADDFDFCDECTTRACKSRYRALPDDKI